MITPNQNNTNDQSLENQEMATPVPGVPAEIINGDKISEPAGSPEPVESNDDLDAATINTPQENSLSAPQATVEPAMADSAAATEAALPNQPSPQSEAAAISKEQAANNVPSPSSLPPTSVPERAVGPEVPKELTAEDKEQIYQEKLKEKIGQVRGLKKEKKERQLREIVDFIRSKSALVSNQEIRAALKIPESTVSYRLKELASKGLVIKVGAGRGVKYRLTAAH